MIAGRMRHRDSAGHEGLLENGGVQWMTAGRGLIHSELPEQEEGRMEGFQLWLNLPAKDKMVPAWYRDIPTQAIPEWQGEGVTARVIAGRTHGVTGAIEREHTEPLYLDLHLAPGAAFSQPLDPVLNAFVYPYRGRVVLGAEPREVAAGRMAILANTAGSDGITLQPGAGGSPRAADRRPAAGRAHRPVRPLRDEHAGRDLPGGGGLPRRQDGLNTTARA
jgi:redox-sensitive bicupin YhaK (pirin superfamily)